MYTAGQSPRHHTHAWGSNFEQLADQVWDMMNQMESRDYFRSHAPHSWRPRLNLYETPDVFIVCVELAGMPLEEIDVRAADGVLHVVGVREKPTLPEDLHDISVHLMEIDSGRFHRKVPIPGDVETEAISAVYRHGYLWIMMPRSSKPRQAGDSG